MAVIDIENVKFPSLPFFFLNLDPAEIVTFVHIGVYYTMREEEKG